MRGSSCPQFIGRYAIGQLDCWILCSSLSLEVINQNYHFWFDAFMRAQPRPNLHRLASAAFGLSGANEQIKR